MDSLPRFTINQTTSSDFIPYEWVPEPSMLKGNKSRVSKVGVETIPTTSGTATTRATSPLLDHLSSTVSDSAT